MIFHGYDEKKMMQGILKNGMVTIIVVSFSKMPRGILHLTMCSQTTLEKSK
jgi:ATP-dependent helicase/DNAse subunit B